MIKNNITVCLYTSTKGHFGRKDIYKDTVNSLLKHMPSDQWGGLVAHIKYDNDSQNKCDEMKYWLSSNGFFVITTLGSWAHGNDSHQIEYLKDQSVVNDFCKTQYCLHLEDDWQIAVNSISFVYWLAKSISILEDNSGITQVRIPRFLNEQQRILGLYAKHGIDGKCDKVNDDYYISNDWSNNPYIARVRDIRGALTFVANTNLPKHSEHGFGKAMKMIAWSEMPFAFLNPEKIKCGHFGTPAGQEDDLTKDNIAN